MSEAAAPTARKWDLAYLRSRVAWTREVWRPHRSWVWVLVLLTLLSAAVTLTYPLVFGYLLDRLSAMEPLVAAGMMSGTEVDAAIAKLIWILLAIAAVRFLAGTYPAFRSLLNYKIDLDVRARSFAVVLRKGHRFFARFPTGDLVTRLTDDIQSHRGISWFCCSGIYRALESLSRVVLCLGVMFWLDPRLSAWALLPLPLSIAVYLGLHRRLGEAVLLQRAAASATSARLESAFSGVQILQARNAEGWQGDAFRRHLQERKQADLRLDRNEVMLDILFHTLNVVGQVVVVVVGGTWVIDGSLSVGTFVAFYLYLEMLLPPMMDLPRLLVSARQAFVCMDRLDELEAFDLGGEGGALRGSRRLEAIGALEAEGLHFAYGAGAPAGNGGGGAALEVAGAPPSASATPGATGGARVVLEGVSLRLERGDRVAVVGPIGAGKSTLALLLAGALVPEHGQVSAGGFPFADLDAASFRGRVGLVPQDSVLFSGTVRDNVLVGREVDEELLRACLDIAGLLNEVARLPRGDRQPLGLRGLGLSGGQRQRVAIARALYGRPELLILDDITAALDAENEERFWARLAETMPGMTALVVTHRLATARRMDRIVVIEAGRLVDGGSHEQLSRTSTYYRAFLARTHATP